MQDNLRPNLLINEQSPYLLQHAYNPVCWRPWNDEAFSIASIQDKPVFVSIGYSTCHWCHVMAHESFEDQEVADFLNQHFISIKVDREEHPDVDALCMDVCQAMTGHGGWPLTIMMDAQQRPFFAGTYFPKRSQHNRLGFLDLLMRLNDVWINDRQRITASARDTVRALSEIGGTDLRSTIRNNIYDLVVEQHTSMFDDAYGGFSVSPKFPSPHHLLLLLRIAQRRRNPELRQMVTLTLDAMRSGGLYDHVGFGFHRYSTDREWIVPHFEKMLYDQAMLMMAYTEAWQITRDDLYRQTVNEILQYVDRELLSPCGAFYGAQDADSEGVEGKFYFWSAEETGVDREWLTDFMSLKPTGNFHDESTGEKSEFNILHFRSPTHQHRPEPDEWETVRKRLFDRRVKRVPPLTDSKILADWNGLMIMGLAKAGRALSDARFTDLAVRAYSGVLEVCGDVEQHCAYLGDLPADEESPGRKGLESTKETASARDVAFLDDLSMMGCAAMELYSATGDAKYLSDAERWAHRIISDYKSPEGALMVGQTKNVGAESQWKNIRSAVDGAYPSGNSMAAIMFAELGIIQGNNSWIDESRSCIESVGQQINNSPSNFCMALCVWDLITNGYQTMSLVGEVNQSISRDVIEFFNSSYKPHVITRYVSAPEGQTVAPHVLVCDEDRCRLPMYSTQDVLEYLAEETRW